MKKQKSWNFLQMILVMLIKKIGDEIQQPNFEHYFGELFDMIKE